MSARVYEVLSPALDSSRLTDSVIVNSLLEHESECKKFTKFCGVFIERSRSNSDFILFTKTFFFNHFTQYLLNRIFRPR